MSFLYLPKFLLCLFYVYYNHDFGKLGILHDFEFDFFSPNYSNFAGECELKSKNFQLRTKFGYFRKVLGFLEKNMIFQNR